MSIKYIEEHDICFWLPDFDTGDWLNPYSCYYDFGLIPTSRPFISIPKVNYTLTQIPNSSIRLNITDYMPGGMTYESRTGEWQFAIDHTRQTKTKKDWIHVYYELEKRLHGAKVYVALNDDPKKIYRGRINISSYDPGDYYSTVTINYDLDAMPIDIQDIEDEMPIYFIVRWLDYKGNVIREDHCRAGEYPAIPSANRYNIYPTNAVANGWDPSVKAVTSNVTYRPKYYYRSKIITPYSSPPVTINRTNILSSHPIQYIIEEPESTVEETYEVPDTVKFLFNNTQYSIDVISEGGKLEKRLWYTPENLEIETE